MSADEPGPRFEPLSGSARGRRRESSRHRGDRFAGLPSWLAWTFRHGVPLISLLPAVVAVALAQGLSPHAQQLPTGNARFAFAGAFAITQPGALGGPPLAGVPAFGWLELGLLLRAVGGGAAPLPAARWALLLLAVATVALTWWCCRRAGASGLAAGAAAAVVGVAPIAVATHATVSVAAIAVPWLLLALALAPARADLAPRPADLTALGAGAAAALAVLTAPPAVVALPGLAWAVLARDAPKARLRLVDDAPPPPPPRRRAVLLAAGFVAVLMVAGVVALVLASRPRTASGSVTAGIAAAAAAQAPFPAAGTAAIPAWLGTDPLTLLVALVALALAVRSGRLLPVSVTALLVLVGSLWPDGRDAVGPVALLLPLAALAIAAAVDEAVVLLGHPRFQRSVVGSGWLMGVAAVLVVAAVVWATGLPRLRPAPDGAVAQASGWLRTSVPAGQVVLAELPAWPTLQASSSRSVGWYAPPLAAGPAPSSPGWSRADYVVSVGATPEPTGSAGAVLDRAETVARFRSGSESVRVLAVASGAAPRGSGSSAGPSPSPGPTSSSSTTPWPGSRPTTTPPSAAQLRASAAARRQTGAELAQNPRITLTGADRAALKAGQVDSRVAIVLAQLAAVHPITVAGFPRVPTDGSEVLRQVLISTVDGKRVPGDPRSTDVLLRYLSRLRGTFATSSLGATTGGVLATFPPDPTFVPAS